MKKVILILFCFSLSAFASTVQYPEYCEEGNELVGCNNIQFNTVDEDLSDILSLTQNLQAQELNDNLRRTAIIRLIEQKRDMLAPFRDLYPHENGNPKIYYQGLAPRERRVRGAHNRYDRRCFNSDPILKNKLDEMDANFDSLRAEAEQEDRKLNLLANMLLGSIAAEEGIKRRPEITQEIEQIDGRISRMQEQLERGEDGNLIHNEFATISDSPCYLGSFGSYNEERCNEYREELAELPLRMELLRAQQQQLYAQREALDQTIFQNPFYADPTGMGDSTSNFFGNIFRSSENDVLLGEYKRSDFLANSFPRLVELKGEDFVENLSTQLKDSTTIEATTGHSGEELGRIALVDVLRENPEFRAQIEGYLQDEIRETVSENDTAVAEICDEDTNLIEIPSLVSQAEADYLETARAELGSDIDVSPFLNSHRQAHCSALTELDNSRWFQNAVGISGSTASMLGGGAATLGLGIASAFGCVPCFGLAIASGAALTAGGIADASNTQSQANALRGLANTGLASESEARDMLRSAELGWAFVGVDLALTPLGLRGGQMIKAGQLISRGRTALQGTGLARNAKFFDTMVRGLPEDEYLEVMTAIRNLPAEEQAALAARFDSPEFQAMNQVDRLEEIRSALTSSGVEFPSFQRLNQVVDQRFQSDPEYALTIRQRYSSNARELGIEAGTPEEQSYLRVMAILEEQGCTGFCAGNARSQREVIEEYQRRMTNCRVN